MTILLTMVGIVVFLISTFTVGFKAAFKRLMGFAVTGLIIDVILIIITACVSFASIY